MLGINASYHFLMVSWDGYTQWDMEILFTTYFVNTFAGSCRLHKPVILNPETRELALRFEMTVRGITDFT